MTDETISVQAEVHIGTHAYTPGEGDKVTSIKLSLKAYKDSCAQILALVPGMRTARVATLLARQGFESFRCEARLQNMRITTPKEERESASLSFELLYAAPAVTLKRLQDFLASFADSAHESATLDLGQMQPELPLKAEGSEPELPLD